VTDRRGVLAGAVGTAAALAATALSGSARAAPAATFLVPGYEPDAAHKNGQVLRADPRASRALPEGYKGVVTMATRLGPAGAVDRALFPLAGHAIAVAPGGAAALFVAMNGAELVRFDTGRLDLVDIHAPHEEGFVFGGHAVFLEEHGIVIVSERRDVRMPYAGDPEAHFGRLSVRDIASLEVLDAWNCHGIAPHDLALTADRRYVAVANYGSTAWPAGVEAPVEGVDYGVEPCLTVLEVPTGALVDKRVGSNPRVEVRHVAAPRLGFVVGLQVRATDPAEAQRALRGRDEVYEADPSDREGLGYLPVPLLVADATDGTGASRAVIAEDRARMVRGQSIVGDPVHDEVIATYTSSNTIAVVGGDGVLRRLIATDVLGLRWPRGLALLPDGEHYAVAGDWENIFVFRRGSHELVREACRYDTLYGHSHLTAT
jgi:hypothetical protein